MVGAHLQSILAEAAWQLPDNVQLRQHNAASQLARAFQHDLEANYLRQRQVQTYADALGVTVNHLVKCVRLTTGVTPKQLLQQRLLLEAMRLLQHSTLTVAEIGRRLQFRDASTFSRWFRTQTSVSPTLFRDKQVLFAQ